MRAVETASVALFFVLASFSFLNFSISVQFIPLAMLAGWLLADLFSGLVHWALDSFGSVRTPIFGPAFIRPFREHHVDPAGMTRHDFIEVNGASCFGCLPLLVLALFLEGFAHALVVFTCLGILVTNQCHKWAHEAPEKVNAVVRFLQRQKLILKAEEHRLHHVPPYNTHFCTASGWLNRPLNALLRIAR